MLVCLISGRIIFVIEQKRNTFAPLLLSVRVAFSPSHEVDQKSRSDSLIGTDHSSSSPGWLKIYDLILKWFKRPDLVSF